MIDLPHREIEANADADYRGNRSLKSTHAHIALLAEGLRS